MLIDGNGMRVRTGDIETISAFVRKSDGDPATGRTTIRLSILRQSDGFLLDWDDMTFKASGHTTLLQAMSEVDGTNMPGIYELTDGLDTSAIANPTANETYILHVSQTSGTDQLPIYDEINMGQWADAAGAERTFASVTYDDNSGNERLRLAAWLQRNGSVVTSPAAITIDWYDQDGTLLFTRTEASGDVSGPDAQGAFLLATSAGAIVLSNFRAHYAKIAITDPLGTITSEHSVPTMG